MFVRTAPEDAGTLIPDRRVCDQLTLSGVTSRLARITVTACGSPTADTASREDDLTVLRQSSHLVGWSVMAFS
jgi:hypothetical protein